MTRTFAALATIVGILVMSMPGGMCFVLMGAGVEHHHHEFEDHAGTACIHVHAHDHEGAGHSHEDDVPEKPCDPAGDNADLLAQAGFLKVDPAEMPAVSDFKPEWVAAPAVCQVSCGANADALDAVDPSPPPLSVRLCRFLI